MNHDEIIVQLREEWQEACERVDYYTWEVASAEQAADEWELIELECRKRLDAAINATKKETA